jgi:hypothetical protein
MIVFDLKCAAAHVFEVWFRDSAAYEAQIEAREIACPVCGDTTIDKAPMAPNLARTRKSDRDGEVKRDVPAPSQIDAEKAGQVMRYLRAARDHVEKNFDNVGERFPEEARKIHHGEVDKRDIYGQASDQEARELEEEGVEIGQLPWLPRHNS